MHLQDHPDKSTHHGSHTWVVCMLILMHWCWLIFRKALAEELGFEPVTTSVSEPVSWKQNFMFDNHPGTSPLVELFRQGWTEVWFSESRNQSVKCQGAMVQQRKFKVYDFSPLKIACRGVTFQPLHRPQPISCSMAEWTTVSLSDCAWFLDTQSQWKS